MNRRWTLVIPAITLLLAFHAAHAGSLSFDFKDPKGVNSMTITLDSPLEPIIGTAHGISGDLVFDPAKPEISAGRFAADAGQVQMANPTMTQAVLSEDWLNTSKYPVISFVLKEAAALEKTGDNTYKTVFRGDFTLKGVTKAMELPVTLAYLPGKAAARNGKGEGDLLVLRTRFSFNRNDFGINPGQMPEKVSETVEIGVAIVGLAPKG